MINFALLCLHVSLITFLTLAALRFGKELMAAWLSLLAVLMNLFVLKQITLFGLSVTSSDALAVGYLLGLNLIQEFFGRSYARKVIWISFFVSLSFLLLSQIHLLYQPNSFDMANAHFIFLLSPMPRIIFASLLSFVIVQFIDLSFFSFLRKKTEGRYLTLRIALALVLSQVLDTLLFSYLGLFGLVASVGHIVCLSLCIKGLVILLTTPFVALSKRMALHHV